MTAYVTIPVSTALGVPAVPNAALRFKPEIDPKQLASLCSKYGVSGGPCGFPRGSGAGPGTGGGAGNAQGGGHGGAGVGPPGSAAIH